MDCPMTVDDIILAEKIFGPEVSSLKGKTVQQTSMPLGDDIIEIPRELIAAQEKAIPSGNRDCREVDPNLVQERL